MKSLLLLAVSLCVLFGSTFAQDPDCNNLLIQLAKSDPSSWAYTLPFLTEPAPTPDNTICGDIVGETSCCDPTFFAALDSAWTAARQGMEEIQTAFEQMDDAADELERQAKDEYYAAIDASTTLTDEQKQMLKNLIPNIIDAMKTFLNNVKNRMVSCIEAMLRYSVGFICLTCREVGFLEVISTTEGKLLLATAVCDDVGGSCAPVMSLFTGLFQSIEDFTVQLCALDPNATDCIDWEAGLPCNDDASCKALICDSLINGFSNAAGFDGIWDDEEVARSAPFQKAIQRLGIQKVYSGLKKIKAAQRLIQQAQRQVEPTLTAVYSENGYDATGVGAKSSLDTSAPFSSASVLSSWIQFLL